MTRATTAFAFVMRHELTPLTTLAVSLDREQDRFLYSSLRDSDTGRVQAGLESSPDALISGTARIGYRNFNPEAADVPGYSGMTASVDVAYVALDAIRFGVQVMRDVEYSYGVGIGYRIGRDLRIGFNVDHYERTSDVALRAYDGLRHGAVATYGR